MLKKMCLQMKKKNKGFTLIELIVVIAILGILAAVLIPTFTGFQKKAQSSQALVDAKQFATAMDSIAAEKGKTAGAFTQTDVENMATMSSASLCTAFSETAGSFTITTTNGNTFTAGRTGYGVKVEIKSGL
ncbi:MULTISPECIES: type II secretion system protein [unclassified Dehalobacter]|uniref:type IV pilin protein n=1 Tax=unclassified Dehalobacter TaxID=2635733 RepID=UPI000A06C4F7|nr:MULTISPECIES: type II secretion system protein [unclassified Dehalobacter]TCX47199.1 type II secretion system protein [Dehalobacter sp. 14DCB1]TCX55341.1 type II secretion system protein [Dehalobacter sp. 12DCB1]